METEPRNAIVLVACAAEKQTQRARAKELYTSDLFKKSRAYAEYLVESGQAKAWYILSAKHGFLDPDKEIDPYDECLDSRTAEGRRAWSAGVWFDMAKRLKPQPAALIFLAGENYRKTLAVVAEKVYMAVEVPMKGLGIGEQKAWLKAALIKAPSA